MSKFLKKNNTVEFDSLQTPESLNTVHNLYLIVVPLLTFFWLFVYTYIEQKLPGKSPRFRMRVVVILHGLIASYIGLSACGHQGLYDKHEPQTNFEGLILANTGSFHIFYTIWMIFNEQRYKFLIVNHAIIGYAFLRFYLQGYSGRQCLCTMGISHTTIPLLYVLWLLRKAGYRNSIYYKIGTILFIVVFVCFRLIISTVQLAITLFSANAQIDYKVILIVLYLVTCYLLKMVYHVYKNSFH